MTQHRKPPHVTTRRTVVAAAGAAGLAAAFSACGDSDSGSGSGDSGNEAGPKDKESKEEQEPESGEKEEKGEKDLGSVAAVPVGGGKVYKAEKVVVTQPEKGTYKGFSAVCQHQGCIVGDVTGGTINCHCHGSKYAVTDGSVKNGPATKPLPAAKVEVEDGKLKLY